MSKFSLDQLTEGIRQRHLGTQNRQLVEKWTRTGLLRGLEGQHREVMSTLLENQAAQLLRERSTLGTGGGAMGDSGDMSGFQNVAFPIVRRVFGGLVANELVSIQPMSLPSGLLFYLDYTYGTSVGGLGSQGGSQYASGSSLYGKPAGKGIRSGSLAVGGQYDLAGSGYSRVYASLALTAQGTNVDTTNVVASGAFNQSSTLQQMDNSLLPLHSTGSDGKLLMFDPQITSEIEANTTAGTRNDFRQSDAAYYALFVRASAMSSSNAVFDSTLVKNVAVFNESAETTTAGLRNIDADIQGGKGVLNVRRLNEIGTYSGGIFTPDALASLTAANTVVKLIISGTTGATAAGVDAGTNTPTALTAYSLTFPVKDRRAGVDDGASVTLPAFESNFGTDPSPEIPEIDIKVESVAVTAQTRKLRARWSPELAQDLNAYHSLDAEVELTQILSEQIALEIDREILNDLVTQADTRFYWSRSPGDFINKRTAVADTSGATFRGTVREWYETLVETVIDVGNEIHRKTLRGSANFIVVSPEVATILEASVMYRPSYSLDGEGQVQTPFSIGAEKVGTLSNRFTVYKDPYFPRNQVLVGYKGGSYLETGYVYAPYVPLIVTPTIFAPEDFTPRKGVMTRYGKKMVRSDFYGTVTCLNMDII
jgi:hypothetical protein